MKTLKKLGIAFASYLLLGWFICQPLTEVGRYKPYFKMSDNGHEISHSELNEFLNIWSKLTQSYYGDSFKGKSLKKASEYPNGLQKWLRLQYWDINRFFYDEQRIRDLMEYIDVKQQLEDSKKITRSHTKINLNNIISDLEKRLDVNSYKQTELELIEVNRYQIDEVLSGRAILKK